MNSNIKIAVIGANKPLLPFYKQAYKLGYNIIGIAWAEGAVCKKYCNKFYDVSFKEKERVLEICRTEKIDGITSFSLESALPTVIYVAQNMGLVSNTKECITLTENKYAQRAAFERNGIPVPQYFRIKSLSDVDYEKVKFPMIIKPIDSGGSQGVSKVNNSEELAESLKQALTYSRSNEAILEEFVDGREFSVEYISCHGIHYNLQITDKVTSGAPHFIEMQHHQPADISRELSTRIRTMVEKALTALKIENSTSHTEIKLNSKGELFIIEIGARMGGDHITSDLVRLSTGYDMVKGCIDLATGHFEKPVIKERHYAGVYFYSELAPNIKNIIVNHESFPDIIEYELDNNPLPKARSNADRGGYLIYQSDKGKLSF